MTASHIEVHEELVRAAFRRMDEDGSGEISLADLRRVLGESLDGEQVEKLVEEAKLMTNGVITLSDFMAYLCGGEAQEAHQEAAGKLIEASMQQMDALEQASLTPMMSPKSGRRLSSLRLP
eukprot:CAMPEP_0204558646 /NCGR_PEP_ID=MMETSP0661-20131031/31270_1 /ASSEMBLY_ACC=CAM_ASM_000606 /TAXON_ID=109239 /ORGANISM="Alexandrium margalefi, Strain AMGDE01CS-322" /LENGTH=120 /DNA_ID=CAMNT_0051565827 /DNA_START=33 /DNA_END=391 /DNA_ORIENTATION=-